MDSTIVKQRIRNRQIEWLELAVVPEDAASMGWYEFVNLWDEVSPKTCFLCMTEPVFTKDEMSQLDRIEELVTALANYPSEDTNDPEWLKSNQLYDALRRQAGIALLECMKRGKFDEEIKQFDVPSEDWPDPFRSQPNGSGT